MKSAVKRLLALILTVILGICLLLDNQVLGWTVTDPEVADLRCKIRAKDYERRLELILDFVYLNDQSIRHIWKPEVAGTVKELIGNRGCFTLEVFAWRSSYFHPTDIAFVQKGFQYQIDYDDIIKITDTFSGRLRSEVEVIGFVFIPEGIDVHSPMRIYYGDDYTSFSVPKEKEKEPDIEQQIKTLERERQELENKILEMKKRIDEIDRALEKFRK